MSNEIIIQAALDAFKQFYNSGLENEAKFRYAMNQALDAADRARKSIERGEDVAYRYPAAKPEPIAWNAPHNRSYEPVETRAKAIYDAFSGPENKPAWTPGGNSNRQDHARMIARRQLREEGHEAAKGCL
jgi:hypothetical protein